MNICCLNVGSKVNLKLEAARHTVTAPKALPEPWFFSQCILSLHSFLETPLVWEHSNSYPLTFLIAKSSVRILPPPPPRSPSPTSMLLPGTSLSVLTPRQEPLSHLLLGVGEILLRGVFHTYRRVASSGGEGRHIITCWLPWCGLWSQHFNSKYSWFL